MVVIDAVGVYLLFPKVGVYCLFPKVGIIKSDFHTLQGFCVDFLCLMVMMMMMMTHRLGHCSQFFLIYGMAGLSCLGCVVSS